MATAIEAELVEASGFEPRRNYERQDYLAALARAIDTMEEDDYDKLSTEAQDWFNEAVKAMNKKKDLPEFPDAATETEAAAATSEDDDDDSEAEESDSDSDGDDDDDAGEDAEEDAEESDEDADPPAAGKAKGKAKAKGKEVKAKPAKKAAAKKVAKKPAKKVEKEPEDDEVEEAPKKALGKRKGVPPRKLDHPPIEQLPPDIDPDEFELHLDEFGIVKGTKNAAAAAMLQKGCRMADITETIGGTYYNLIGRLVKAGHTIEKSANGVLKLTPTKAKKGKK